jgi:AraC family transcriptional regulator of adaptative response / DNA-3-methyladenine glycosylase II
MDVAIDSNPEILAGLDPQVCERASLARDSRFDGRFFVGVRTTGIYCRPICPVPQPKAQNVRYFLTAAAAAEAGFRPCLRCRPESSPGTPAWQGTSATVARALRLVSEGALDGGSVERLAVSLGIGPRHLRRLFLRHLGASPLSLAQTRRLHFAKKLIDETAFPMSQVALSAGFGSVRRFNAVIRKVYGRTPGELRRRAGRRAENGEACSLRLGFRPPFDWEALIDFLAPRATPGVEEVTAGRYRRTIQLAGRTGTIDVCPVRDERALRLDICFPDPAGLLPIVERARRMFDLHADPLAIVDQLRGDKLLAPLVEARPGVRVPGCWDGFELAVRAILGQQVTVKGATTLAGRVATAFGMPLGAVDGGLTVVFPTAERLATADLSNVGLPAARAHAIRELARAVLGGDVIFDGSLDPTTLARRLTAVPGVGDWTAQYVVMRALGDPDAFPATDLGLLQAFAGGTRGSARELRVQAERWRPWRAYAAMHLWRRAAAGMEIER